MTPRQLTLSFCALLAVANGACVEPSGEGEGEGEGESDVEQISELLDDCELESELRVGAVSAEQLSCVQRRLCPQEGVPRLDCEDGLDQGAATHEACVERLGEVMPVEWLSWCPNANVEDVFALFLRMARVKTCAEFVLAHDRGQEVQALCAAGGRRAGCATSDVIQEADGCRAVFTDCEDMDASFVLNCQTSPIPNTCVCESWNGDQHIPTWDQPVDEDEVGLCSDPEGAAGTARRVCGWLPR